MIDVNVMPFAKLMGVTIIEARAESVIAELFVREDLCTSNSILHGGAVMAFADSVGAVATVLNLPPGANTTTIESKTNFVAAFELARPRARSARRSISAARPWCGKHAFCGRTASSAPS